MKESGKKAWRRRRTSRKRRRRNDEEMTKKMWRARRGKREGRSEMRHRCSTDTCTKAKARETTFAQAEKKRAGQPPTPSNSCQQHLHALALAEIQTRLSPLRCTPLQHLPLLPLLLPLVLLLHRFMWRADLARCGLLAVVALHQPRHLGRGFAAVRHACPLPPAGACAPRTRPATRCKAEMARTRARASNLDCCGTNLQEKKLKFSFFLLFSSFSFCMRPRKQLQTRCPLHI